MRFAVLILDDERVQRDIGRRVILMAAKEIDDLKQIEILEASTTVEADELVATRGQDIFLIVGDHDLKGGGNTTEFFERHHARPYVRWSGNPGDIPQHVRGSLDIAIIEKPSTVINMLQYAVRRAYRVRMAANGADAESRPAPTQ